jgi:hypothetical protein
MLLLCFAPVKRDDALELERFIVSLSELAASQFPIPLGLNLVLFPAEAGQRRVGGES